MLVAPILLGGLSGAQDVLGSVPLQQQVPSAYGNCADQNDAIIDTHFNCGHAELPLTLWQMIVCRLMPCIGRDVRDHQLHMHRSSGMLVIMHARDVLLMCFRDTDHSQVAKENRVSAFFPC